MLLTPPDFFEDDPIEVSLQLKHSHLKPAFLVCGREVCPFAPPTEQVQPFFAPSLFKNEAVTFNYQTTCDRRGFYTFDSIPLGSKGPFNMFNTRRTLTVPGRYEPTAH